MCTVVNKLNKAPGQYHLTWQILRRAFLQIGSALLTVTIYDLRTNHFSRNIRESYQY